MPELSVPVGIQCKIKDIRISISTKFLLGLHVPSLAPCSDP